MQRSSAAYCVCLFVREANYSDYDFLSRSIDHKIGQRKAPPAAPTQHPLTRTKGTQKQMFVCERLRHHCSASHEMWNFILFPSLSSSLAFKSYSYRFGSHIALFSLFASKNQNLFERKNKNIDGMCVRVCVCGAAIPRYAFGVNCSCG